MWLRTYSYIIPVRAIHAVALPFSALRNSSRNLTVTTAGWRTERLEPDQPKPEYLYVYSVLAAPHDQASCSRAMHCTLRNAHLAGKGCHAMPSQKQWHKNVANTISRCSGFWQAYQLLKLQVVTSSHSGLRPAHATTCFGGRQTSQAHHAAPQV
jgi:hypothetical protein